MIESAAIIFAVFALVFGVVVFLDVRKAKKHGVKYRFRQAATAALFLLPACVLAFFFVLLPILYSLGYSFTNYDLLKWRETKFTGFENFANIFKAMASGGKLTMAIKNTAIFVGLVVPIQISLALGLALFCHVKAKGNVIFKVCFFIPVAVSLTVTAYLWGQLLSPSETGILNTLLAFFGLPKQDAFIDNPDMTMIWIVIVSAWQGAGYQMLIFLSGLTGIKKELYEAARMDGCNAFQRFWKVTIPGLRPTMLYVLITVFIGACRIMIQPMLMVPGYHDNNVTLSYYMWFEGFKGRDVGYSSAVALLMTIFVGTITLIQRKLLGGRSNDQ